MIRMSDARFPARFRLRRGADFARVYERHRSASDDVLLVYACENTLGYPRLGVSVSRKVGGAVERNRWKRLIREAFRLSRNELPAGVDLVVIPRATDAELRAIRASLVRLAARAAVKLDSKQVRPSPLAGEGGERSEPGEGATPSTS
jgi:ribonuclease P protein component